MFKHLAVLALALCAGASVAPATAQAAGARRQTEGFYGSIGVGYGSLSVTCTDCESNNTNSMSFYAGAGGTLSQKWRLGAEYDMWRKSEDGFTLSVGYFLANATLYPSANNDLWIKFGAGYTNATGSGGGSSSSSNGGAAGAIGLGYDWHVTEGGLALIPYLSYDAQLTSSGGEGKANVFQVGVGIGYRH